MLQVQHMLDESFLRELSVCYENAHDSAELGRLLSRLGGDIQMPMLLLEDFQVINHQFVPGSSSMFIIWDVLPFVQP